MMLRQAVPTWLVRFENWSSMTIGCKGPSIFTDYVLEVVLVRRSEVSRGSSGEATLALAPQES